jgi:hypothetical protein
MNETKTISVWEVKKLQDKLFDHILRPLFDAGLDDEAREIINAFEKVIDKAVE